MRWVIVLLLWLAAIVVAVLILRRVRRGKPVVLAGRWSPRLVRMIAVVLVVLGAGDEGGPSAVTAAPLKLPIRSADDELPASLRPAAIQRWLAEHREHAVGARDRQALLRVLAGKKVPDVTPARIAANNLPTRLRAIVHAEIEAVRLDKPIPPTTNADLLAALDEMEKIGQFDHYWAGYVWRKSAAAGPAGRIELYARVRQHARVTDALIRAYAQVKPITVSPRAWMSKAGPRPEERAALQAYAASLADMVKVAAEVLPTTDAGTWARDGIVRIKPITGEPAPVLVRAGKARDLPADEATRFGRLDLLKTGDKSAAIGHDWLGKIELPANRLVSVWDLPDLLSDAAKQKLDQAALDALKTNAEDAADRLERCLPLSHAAIRAGLKELPDAKGAPRLRLILTLFDDTPMPTLRVYQPATPAGRGAGLGGPRR